MDKIKIAIVGMGNCASSLIQGIEYYRNKKESVVIGLMHWDIGGYKPSDIEVVAAFDIDKRKVGSDLSEAIIFRIVWPIIQAVGCVTPIRLARTTEDMPLLELVIRYIAWSHFHSGKLVL